MSKLCNIQKRFYTQLIQKNAYFAKQTGLLPMAQKATSILLVILILVVSMGLTINKHYCQNELKATAVFTTPPSCHAMSMPSTNCHFKKAKSTKSCCSKGNNLLVKSAATCSKDCCHNESEYQHLEEDLTSNYIQNPSFGNPCSWSKILLITPTKTMLSDALAAQVAYLNYKPPLLSVFQNLPVLHQSFLI